MVEEMEVVFAVIEQGRRERRQAGIPDHQPLSAVTVIPDHEFARRALLSNERTLWRKIRELGL